MEWWKIAALCIAGIYIVTAGFALFGKHSEAPSDEELYYMVTGIVGWLALSLGCILWGEELGSALTGARMMRFSSSSPGWAVRLMGWILLFLPVIIGFVYYLKQ